jgi:hypothetical protein
MCRTQGIRVVFMADVTDDAGPNGGFVLGECFDDRINLIYSVHTDLFTSVTGKYTTLSPALCDRVPKPLGGMDKRRRCRAVARRFAGCGVFLSHTSYTTGLSAGGFKLFSGCPPYRLSSQPAYHHGLAQHPAKHH